MTEEKLEISDGFTRFDICPGRYYSVMFFINIPDRVSKFGHGGDITGLLWRHADKPDQWHLTYRFRHYADDSGQVFGSKDTRSWFANKEPMVGEEMELAEKTKKAIEMMGEMTNKKPNFLEIHGDHEAFQRAVKTQKPYWMHLGVTDEVAGRGGDPKGN